MTGQGTKPPTPPHTRCMTSFDRRLQVPGYSKVEASAFYTPTAFVLRLQVIFHPSPKNRGPRLLENKVVQWMRIHNVAGMRKALEEYVDSLEKSLTARTYPERTSLYERCNPSGDLDFLEKTCADCICPHCEIATSLG